MCRSCDPRFQFFRKFLDFQPCFGPNSSSLDQNFSKFSFPRPPFFKENPLPRPYILKPAWHTSTKKKLSAPPPREWVKNCVIAGLRGVWFKKSTFLGGGWNHSWLWACKCFYNLYHHKNTCCIKRLLRKIRVGVDMVCDNLVGNICWEL